MTIYSIIMKCILSQLLRNKDKPMSHRCEDCGLEPICIKMFNQDPLDFDLDKLVELGLLQSEEKDYIMSLECYKDYIEEVNNEY